MDTMIHGRDGCSHERACSVVSPCLASLKLLDSQRSTLAQLGSPRPPVGVDEHKCAKYKFPTAETIEGSAAPVKVLVSQFLLTVRHRLLHRLFSSVLLIPSSFPLLLPSPDLQSMQSTPAKVYAKAWGYNVSLRALLLSHCSQCF